MSRKLKKVVVVIVEGESEEILMTDRLRQIFNEHQIQFEVQRGDILFSFENRRKSIKSIIGDLVKRIISVRKYKNSDILAVIHIIDTDGCLIADERVIKDELQNASIKYFDDKIVVPSEKQKEFIITRNKERKRNIETLNSINSILNDKIPYRLYYMSRNLEHVIFNEPNPDHSTKLENVDQFVENLDCDLEEYLGQFMFDIPLDDIEDRYRESWIKVANDTESLKRRTNIPLLFEFLGCQ